MLLIITLHAHQSHQTPNTSVVVGVDKGYVNQKHKVIQSPTLSLFLFLRAISMIDHDYYYL